MRASGLGFVLALAAAMCLETGIAAQATNSKEKDGGQQPSAAPQGSKETDDWLNRVRLLYTSTARDGLKGFDCTVHPDWHAIFAQANNGVVDSDRQHRIDVLNTARVILHARLNGNSNVEWIAGDEPADMADILKSARDGTKQTLEGFMQFWTAFADASVVPENSQGLEFTRTADGGYLIHGVQSGTEVTETFDSSGLLHEFDVKESGQTVLFTPTFTLTPKGWRVTYFLAHIRPDNSTQDQEMRVNVAYSDVEGFAIPSQLNLTVIGTGTFNLSLDGCKVNP